MARKPRPRDTWDSLLDELRADNRSGATTLTARALEGLRALARQHDTALTNLPMLQTWLRELAIVRPPIASIFQIANWATQAVAVDCPADRSAELLDHTVTSVMREMDHQYDAITRISQTLLSEAPRVLTISVSRFVLGALADAHSRGVGLEITCLESRPASEGVEMARLLAEAGVSVRLAVDAAAGWLLREVDFVLVGGDTLSPSGLVHKLGTLGLAMAARERDVPLCALVGTLKALPAAVRGWQEDGGPAGEVSAEAVSGVQVWNRYFDLTPLDLLTGVVTEHGVMTAREAADLAAEQPIHPWLEDLLES